MPRIPEPELERLKREVSIESLCAKYGIELKPQGKDLIGRCPFHEDRTPSFVVTPAKNLWNCLGACGCGGDNIQLVMKREKASFRHAVETLQTMAGAAPAPAGQHATPETRAATATAAHVTNKPVRGDPTHREPTGMLRRRDGTAADPRPRSTWPGDGGR